MSSSRVIRKSSKNGEGGHEEESDVDASETSDQSSSEDENSNSSDGNPKAVLRTTLMAIFTWKWANRR